MVLLRRVIGDALRARRLAQHRTLREVSAAANVSLGYLSEIERGHKEASSELLASICDALGAQQSEVLREVSDTLALTETRSGVLAPVGGGAHPERAALAEAGARPAAAARVATATLTAMTTPLDAVRSARVAAARRGDVVCAA